MDAAYTAMSNRFSISGNLQTGESFEPEVFGSHTGLTEIQRFYFRIPPQRQLAIKKVSYFFESVPATTLRFIFRDFGEVVWESSGYYGCEDIDVVWSNPHIQSSFIEIGLRNIGDKVVTLNHPCGWWVEFATEPLTTPIDS